MTKLIKGTKQAGNQSVKSQRPFNWLHDVAHTLFFTFLTLISTIFVLKKLKNSIQFYIPLPHQNN